MTERKKRSRKDEHQADVSLPVSIRAHAPGYAGATFLTLFAAAFLLYLEYPLVSLAIALTSITLIPFLAFTDRIVFDGRRLIRTGLLPKTWYRLNGLRTSIKLRSIEQIDTAIVGSFKRGGRVRFLHRTTVFGNAPSLIFAGSGARYRKMVATLFAYLDPALLDIRSYELSRFNVTPQEAVRAAAELNIPPSDVLETSLRSRPIPNNILIGRHDPRLTEGSNSELLRAAANKLATAGLLVRALEAFRRALHSQPKNARLLFEFSRCLHLLAFVRRNERFEHRAAAALRLAEKRADGDTDLLQRIAESYRQFGYTRRAANAYRAVIDRIGDGFRSLIGLAELALDEGKLAHVVHNFSAANRVATTAAMRRWTSAEADYFTRLSGDDEYMELELSRMNLLEKLDRWRRTAFRIGLYSLPLAAFGSFFGDELIAEAGWLVSSIGFLTWVGMNIGLRMLSPRIPYELVESEK